MTSTFKRNTRNSGFTLVELAVVVVIIGVLAAFAVPRFLSSVERSKAAEAFNYLSTIHSAQERYQARQGTYADDITNLDTEMESAQYFSVGTVEVPSTASSLEDGWEITMTRTGASAGYGAYTVVWTHEGFDSSGSTIDSEISPLQTTS
ncbi:MAG: prepilin-type cleavage/methylation domain-containing protein [Planctomycetota bacterium]|nr:MAG: prepilin-type cleavage/methylation domain-containing protein [Planctomycetota bacterium]